MKHIAASLMAVVAIVSALIVFLVGCGTEDASPPIVTASSDGVSVKPERGERGEKGDSIVGPQGPAGRDGRDAPTPTAQPTPIVIVQTPAPQPTPSAEPVKGYAWRDPVTEKRWVYAGSRATWATAPTVCGDWKLPTAAILQRAIYNGMLRTLAAEDVNPAWSLDPAANDPTLAVAVTTSVAGGVRGTLAETAKSAVLNVYCYAP